jgi:acetyl-CoA carboxylase carboxyl transferase subunit beta
MDLSWFRRKKKDLTGEAGKREIPDGLWQKCPSCAEIIYRRELERNLSVCFKCGHHFRISCHQYVELLTDRESFIEYFSEITSIDPLSFKDSKNYDDRIKAAKKKTGLGEAILCGEAKIDGNPLILGVMDFSFMGGSMGSALGEKVARSIELAIKRRLGIVIVCSSGGARMQEGILSLMQMAKTSSWLARLDQQQLPYISILTNPTTAGVMASYASLGDVVMAEPGALIGFAGPRVIKQTTGEDMPEDRQKAESMLEHGMMDMIVPRTELRETVAHLLSLTYKSLQIGPWAKQAQDADSALAGNRITKNSTDFGAEAGPGATSPRKLEAVDVARRLQDLQGGPDPSQPTVEPPGA